MPLSGLLVTLSDDMQASAAALASISANERLVVGRCIGSRIPVIVDSSSPAEDRRQIDWLRRLHGVVSVSTVFFYVDEPEESAWARCEAALSNHV